MTVTLTIPGVPKPKGSLKCLGRRGRVAHQLVEDAGPELRDWRDRIAETVRTRVRTRGEPGETVHVDVTFTIPRPAYHYGTGRNAQQLRPKYAAAPATARGTGDVDKLARLLLDALQDGGLLADDAQATDLTARKRYVDAPGGLPYPGARIVVAFPDRTEQK